MRMSFLVSTAIAFCCATNAFGDPLPPPAPVTDADSAIKIARQASVGNRDLGLRWSAVLQDGVWNVQAKLVEKPYCGRPSGLGVEIEAATGKVERAYTTKLVC